MGTKRDIKYKDYDEEMMSDKLWSAGKAAYVERNQDMIDASSIMISSINRLSVSIQSAVSENINRKAEQRLRMNMLGTGNERKNSLP